jgi:hypothetical protein
MLRGPISREPADTRTYLCFAARVMDTFFTETVPEPSRDPTCFHSCPGQPDDSSDDSFDDEVCLISIVIIHHPHVSSFLSQCLSLQSDVKSCQCHTPFVLPTLQPVCGPPIA